MYEKNKLEKLFEIGYNINVSENLSEKCLKGRIR